MDVAIIVSSDTDLSEVARVVHDVTRSRARVSVEAAVIVGSRRLVLLEHYDFTHQLRRLDFDQFSDSFDYDTNLDEAMVEAFLGACWPGDRT